MASGASIHKLLELLKVMSRVEKSPGFSAALGLTPNYVSTLSSDELWFKDSTLSVRLPLTNGLLLPTRRTVSLSTYLAIIDDVTTWALVLADPKRGRAGVSVSLSAEWGPAVAAGRYPGDVVDVHAKVNKVGRNLGFVRAEVRDLESGDLVCFGSHIKYLPMGAMMDLLQSSSGWGLAKVLSEYACLAPSEETVQLSSLFEFLKFGPDQLRATFQVSPHHASLGGPIHGGCQAVLMELAASHAVESLAGSDDLSPSSLSVEYLSTPSAKEVDLVVDKLAVSKQSLEHSTRVQLLSKGRPSSEGVIRFRRASGLHAPKL